MKKSKAKKKSKYLDINQIYKEQVKKLWSWIKPDSKVWLVFQDSRPHIVDPSFIYNETDKDEDKEASLTVFKTSKEAMEYADYLSKLEDLEPSLLTLAQIKLKDLWDLLPQVNEFCIKEHEVPLKLDIAGNYKNLVLIETLWSKKVTIN